MKLCRVLSTGSWPVSALAARATSSAGCARPRGSAPPARRPKADRLAALGVARAFGMAVHPTTAQCAFNWDGAALNGATEAYVILHEIAHFVLAPPERRGLVDFGLGPGPDTLDRAAAETGGRALAAGARRGRGPRLAARHRLGGGAGPARARLVPRPELARRPRPLRRRPFHSRPRLARTSSDCSAPRCLPTRRRGGGAPAPSSATRAWV